MTYRNIERLAISSSIFYSDESRSACAQLLLSDLVGHFDSREISLDPFLKIPCSLQKRNVVLSSKNRRQRGEKVFDMFR